MTLRHLEIFLAVAETGSMRKAAEQLYTGSGRGAEKKAYVVEFLNSKGFKIDAETLDKLIEAAVFNLPDYFTISGIPADTDSNK